MKYVVTVDGERVEVDVGPDGLRYGVERDRIAAAIRDIVGTPIRMVSIGDSVHRVVIRRGATRGAYTLWIGGFRYEVEALDERTRTIRDVTGASAGPAGPVPIVAPMPGLIVRVGVAPGDEIQIGDGIIVMEAMKMENELRAVGHGRVKAVLVSAGQAVEKGAVLVEME